MGVLTLASYWRWIEFFRDRRYPAYWRLILTLLFAAMVISFPNWGLDAEWRNLFSSRVLQDYRGLRQFVLISVRFLIPLGTFYYMLAVDTVVFGTWLLRVIFEYLRSAHSPLPKDLIRELALEPIPSSRGERKGWRLTELAEAELESLRKWAAANREGTDKRLLPTAVLFGVLATFANTQTFNRAIDRVLVWSAEVLSTGPLVSEGVLTFMGKEIVLASVLLLGMVFLYQLLLLFRNLVTQSLIIEACIVVEYACKQHQSIESRTKTGGESQRPLGATSRSALEALGDTRCWRSAATKEMRRLFTMPIGRLEKVSLREIWPNEARDFTTWLAENLDFLGEALELSLSLIEQEAAAGIFSADILAEDSDGNPVIIENQLERTDHDHLGKLITYLSNLDAKTAIWITSNPRPEHETAIHWLNETLPADVALYLVKLEAYHIGDSRPAPLLTVVAGPSPETKQIGGQKKELAQRHVLRLDFWRQLLDQAKEHTKLHSRISPSKQHWSGAGAGKAGLAFNYVIRMSDAQVELYIDQGEGEANKRIFDRLFASKEKAEEAFGEPLEWQRLDDRRACRIRHRLHLGGLADRGRWPEIQEAMIDAMVRLEKALKPQIKRLRT